MEDLWVAPAMGEEEKPQKPTKKHYDRFGSINTFLDVTMRSLNLNQRAVWLLLWRDTKDGVARTGQTDLARRAGICTRTVSRAIKSLAEKGLLEVVRRGYQGGGPSIYKLLPWAKHEGCRCALS